MPTARARRGWPVLLLQLLVLGTGLAATYDRGPLAALTAWIVGRDRQAEARARAIDRASVNAQRIPANAVRGADGQTLHAVVRLAPPPPATARLQRQRWSTRASLILLAVLATASSVRRRRRRRRAHPELRGDASPPTWPVAHDVDPHVDPPTASVERSDARRTSARPPRS